MDKQQALTIFDQEVLKDQLRAHILLEQPQSSDCLDQVRQIMVSLGGAILEERQMPPKWLMVKLEAADIRDVALRLAELGHVIVKGFARAPEVSRASERERSGGH